MKFLFWNIKRNPVGPILSQLAREHCVDVVVLAECRDAGAILLDLNSTTENQFHIADSKSARVVIYTRFPVEFIQSVYDERSFTIQHLSLLGRKEVLMAAAHLPSKRFSTAEEQTIIAAKVSATIQKCEERLGHSRTILVGDLNMNPFEKGMISASTLHAVMTKDLAATGSRVVRSERYPFFYNPMWGCFGDITKGPPGTYYRRGSSHLEYFWNVFDQVLIRPALLDDFEKESLQVLTKYGETTLLRPSRVPDAARASDHLPLLFALNI